MSSSSSLSSSSLSAAAAAAAAASSFLRQNFIYALINNHFAKQNVAKGAHNVVYIVNSPCLRHSPFTGLGHAYNSRMQRTQVM